MGKKNEAISLCVDNDKVTKVRATTMPKAYVDATDQAEEERIVTEIVELTTRMNQMVALTVLEIGRRLTEAKRLVRHGEWANWLKQRVNYSQRTANNYMRIYREYGESGLAENSQSIANLGYTQALAILDAPKEDRERLADEVAERDMTIRELRDAVRIAKESAREQADAARQEQKRETDSIRWMLFEANEREKDLSIRVHELEERAADAERDQDEALAERLQDAVRLERAELATTKAQLEELRTRQRMTVNEERLKLLVERTLDDYSQALDVIQSIGETDKVQAMHLFEGLDSMLTDLHDKADKRLRS